MSKKCFYMLLIEFEQAVVDLTIEVESDCPSLERYQPLQQKVWDLKKALISHYDKEK